MSFQPPDLSARDLPSRRELIHCLAILALGCGCRSLLPATRHARYFLQDPHPEDYRPILSALLETVLPLDDPKFPRIVLGDIERRFLRMFRLEAERRFLVLQQALLFFDDVELFPRAVPAILREEQRVSGERGSALESLLSKGLRHDRGLFDRFREGIEPKSRFVSLALERRRLYFRLWTGSAFSVKRHFARSSRDLGMIAAYSHPEVWSAIGYEGPFIAPG